MFSATPPIVVLPGMEGMTYPGAQRKGGQANMRDLEAGEREETRLLCRLRLMQLQGDVCIERVRICTSHSQNSYKRPPVL